jgi:glycerophosphoryl diester phosphodiesterase
VANIPLLLGHRGSRVSASVRENSLPAFDLALQHGCDGFEFDVRLTADGSAIVCHDAKFQGHSIAEGTAAQFRDLPLLDDVMARFSKRAFLDIELKVPGLAQHVMAALREHIPERAYVVSSFLPHVLVEVRNRDESIPLGIICDRKLPPWQELPIEYLIPHASLITRALVREAHDAGKVLFAWTVNDKSSMLRLADWGVDGIISDNTELLVRTLKPG